MDVGEDTTSKAAKGSFKVAKKHLAKAIELDPNSLIYVQYAVSVCTSSSGYLPVIDALFQLLLHKERPAQGRGILERYCKHNPADPGGLR